MLDGEYEGCAQCGCWMIVLVANFFLGGWAVNFLLGEFATKTLPYFWAGVVGIFTGEITIPFAIVVKILVWFGVL